MRATRRILLTAIPGLLAMPAHAWLSPGVVRVVVPYTAGSSMDVMGRAIGDKVAARWKQTVIVENRGGVGGNIGAEYVAKADADGNTLLLASMSIATNQYLYPSMKWDPLKLLRPVTLICQIPNVMVVPAASPCRTVDDFVRLARSKPGALNYGSAGAGTSMHLGAELFMRATGTQLIHVPYRGSVPAMTDLISGQIDMLVATLASALVHIRAGQVRALGVTTSSRSAVTPDIPTIAESGVPNFDMSAWYGILAPAKTSDSTIERMSQDMRWALADPSVRGPLESLCMQIVASSPNEFGDFLAQESTRWAEVIRRAAIRLE